MKDYRSCKHRWEITNVETIVIVRCKSCGLDVEVYHNHVSVWDYTQGTNTHLLGTVEYPDPEDEEETELEPEEIQEEEEGYGDTLGDKIAYYNREIR